MVRVARKDAGSPGCPHYKIPLTVFSEISTIKKTYDKFMLFTSCNPTVTGLSDNYDIMVGGKKSPPPYLILDW